MQTIGGLVLLAAAVTSLIFGVRILAGLHSCTTALGFADHATLTFKASRLFKDFVFLLAAGLLVSFLGGLIAGFQIAGESSAARDGSAAAVMTFFYAAGMLLVEALLALLALVPLLLARSGAIAPVAGAMVEPPPLPKL
ncbi:MAG: hypothetical protein HS115_11465 [Spirochaetales bacterium]|nr:hypothetical protein [Spirochaetales bacterium]